MNNINRFKCCHFQQLWVFNMEIIKKKIIEKNATIAVIGLGYVGLPTALEFSKKGFNVIGVDVDKDKVEMINKGICPIKDSLMIKDLKTEIAKKKMKCTNRFSPGYCGWNIKGQKELFSLLPENYCKISLTNSFLMNPVKSISGIIGIGKKVEWKDYQCTLCGKKDCPYRKRNE